MTERLPAHLEAASLIRRAEVEGGFGTLLKRGDPDRGSLILLLSSRGRHWACFERALSPDGSYRWQQVGPAAGADAGTLSDWSQKRVRFDEDLWLIELDIAVPERFIVETGLQG
ncbi:MAG: DUF1491 family protein [Pseudomonadota bacterium]|nr:DUF1491 family protein [Pseudomonadota bacterium]